MASRFKATHVVRTVIARPVYCCKKHAEEFVRRANLAGLEPAMSENHEEDKQCESCICITEIGENNESES